MCSRSVIKQSEEPSAEIQRSVSSGFLSRATTRSQISFRSPSSISGEKFDISSSKSARLEIKKESSTKTRLEAQLAPSITGFMTED